MGDNVNKIHVDCSQVQTEKGAVTIETYTSEGCALSRETLEKLLSGLAEKEGMAVRKIDYCEFDYWGYRKYHTSLSKEDIHDICCVPLGIDGYFEDRETRYRFMYLDDDHQVIIAQCRKASGIDLESVFDGETSRKAKGLLSSRNDP